MKRAVGGTLTISFRDFLNCYAGVVNKVDGPGKTGMALERIVTALHVLRALGAYFIVYGEPDESDRAGRTIPAPEKITEPGAVNLFSPFGVSATFTR